MEVCALHQYADHFSVENRNGEEKHLALNLENVMPTTEPIRKLLVWLNSAPRVRKVHIISVSLFLWWMLQSLSEPCAPLSATAAPISRRQCSQAGTLQGQMLVSFDCRRSAMAGLQTRSYPIRCLCLKMKFLS